MSYTNFNRHESMDSETRNEILNIISELRNIDAEIESLNSLENMMYGLFDGYLYENVQLYALELPTKIASRVMKVYDTCSRYPKSNTQTY